MNRCLLLLVAVLTAALAAGAVACGDDEGDGGAGTTTTAPTSDDEPTDGAGGGFSAIIEGEEDEDEGITGTVTISAGGDGVEVVAELEGMPPGAHANHLHHGSCDVQGEVHVTLEEMEIDADGSGEATSTFDDPPLEHFAEGHYYAVHEGTGADTGRAIGCGDISE